MITPTKLVPNLNHLAPRQRYMRKHSNNKKWTAEIEGWGATRARTVAKRTLTAWTRAKVRAEVQPQPWDLVRVQALVLFAALAEARAHAEARAEVEAEEARRLRQWLRQWPRLWVNAEARAWVAEARAWALELAEVYKAMRAWMQALGEGKERKMQAWIRGCALEAAKLELERDIWPRCREDYWWLIQVISPITRLPPELLHHIFLIIIDKDNDSASSLVLMRVCKYWHNIVNRIWAPLKLGTTTPPGAITSKLKKNQCFFDVLVDTEIDQKNNQSPRRDRLFYPAFGSQIDRSRVTPSGNACRAILAAMQATSRWRTLIVKTFPAQADLPERLVNPGLQQCSNPVMSRLRTLIIKSPCEMSPLLDRLLRILGNTASRELTTVTINSPIVISFLLPTYSSIFRSVTVLSLDAPGLPNPVDLLPHLHQLEAFTASHLPLPVYHDDVDLPFVHTLRHLTLRAVAIQWMSGRTFHVLESCTILFPLHRHVPHMFHTTLPNCKHLSFEGYPLDILSGVSTNNITQLSAKCPSSYKPRGNRQLALLSSRALQECRLAPRILHIGIEATNKAWTKAFAYMSKLEELVIDNAQPSSLGVKALRSLVVLPVHANNTGTTATPVERNTPACPSLKRFGLRYRRWLRPSEHFDLIPVFMSIIWSRQQSQCPLQSFRIWRRSTKTGPLELVDGSQISLEGFERLANVSAIKGRN